MTEHITSGAAGASPAYPGRFNNRLPRTVGSASVPAGDRAALVGSAKSVVICLLFLRAPPISARLGISQSPGSQCYSSSLPDRCSNSWTFSIPTEMTIQLGSFPGRFEASPVYPGRFTASRERSGRQAFPPVVALRLSVAQNLLSYVVILNGPLTISVSCLFSPRSETPSVTSSDTLSEMTVLQSVTSGRSGQARTFSPLPASGRGLAIPRPPASPRRRNGTSLLHQRKRVAQLPIARNNLAQGVSFH